MTLFCVAYRIEWNDTYNDRYDSLIEQIKKNLDPPRWHHTTSMFLGNSKNTKLDIAYNLYYRSKIISPDHVLVINLDHQTFKFYGGNPTDLATLRQLFTEL